MKSAIFRDQVVNAIRCLDTIIPLDVAMMQVPISNATVMDVSPVIGGIAHKYIDTVINFGDLYRAAPPSGQENLFVEFRARDAFPPPHNLGWYGVHVVPYATAAGSLMFKNAPLPEQLRHWPQVYSMLIYRMATNEITIAPYSTIIGVDPLGCVSEPGFFSVARPSDAAFDEEAAVGETALIIYSVLTSFAMVSRGESLLVRLLCDTPVYRLENARR
ncbi:MAG: hypothetical protein GX491_05375 [Chloroflexi bacterium]|nr:hypothetical protein [Chloroflexota bacterium]